MRKSVELDNLLENAVAMALGLPRPHPQQPKKLRVARAKPSHRHRATGGSQHREHARAAA